MKALARLVCLFRGHEWSLAPALIIKSIYSGAWIEQHYFVCRRCGARLLARSGGLVVISARAVEDLEVDDCVVLGPGGDVRRAK